MQCFPKSRPYLVNIELLMIRGRWLSHMLLRFTGIANDDLSCSSWSGISVVYVPPEVRVKFLWFNTFIRGVRPQSSVKPILNRTKQEKWRYLKIYWSPAPRLRLALKLEKPWNEYTKGPLTCEIKRFWMLLRNVSCAPPSRVGRISEEPTIENQLTGSRANIEIFGSLDILQLEAGISCEQYWEVLLQ